MLPRENLDLRSPEMQWIASRFRILLIAVYSFSYFVEFLIRQLLPLELSQPFQLTFFQFLNPSVT